MRFLTIALMMLLLSGCFPVKYHERVFANAVTYECVSENFTFSNLFYVKVETDKSLVVTGLVLNDEIEYPFNADTNPEILSNSIHFKQSVGDTTYQYRIRLDDLKAVITSVGKDKLYEASCSII